MYSVVELKNKNKMLDKAELMDIDGFLMGSKNRVFKINNCNIREIKVVNKKLANPLVSKKVLKAYNKLLAYLTELLVDDDDSGETCREALNQIERFRVQVKNKYREYLTQKELEKMSKQLKTLQKAATEKFIQIQNSYMEYQNDNKRSK